MGIFDAIANVGGEYRPPDPALDAMYDAPVAGAGVGASLYAAGASLQAGDLSTAGGYLGDAATAGTVAAGQGLQSVGGALNAIRDSTPQVQTLMLVVSVAVVLYVIREVA